MIDQTTVNEEYQKWILRRVNASDNLAKLLADGTFYGRRRGPMSKLGKGGTVEQDEKKGREKGKD